MNKRLNWADAYCNYEPWFILVYFLFFGCCPTWSQEHLAHPSACTRTDLLNIRVWAHFTICLCQPRSSVCGITSARAKFMESESLWSWQLWRRVANGPCHTQIVNTRTSRSMRDSRIIVHQFAAFEIGQDFFICYIVLQNYIIRFFVSVFEHHRNVPTSC